MSTAPHRPSSPARERWRVTRKRDATERRAQALKDGAHVLTSSDAKPPRSRQSPANDRRRDAPLVSLALDARPRPCIPSAITARPLHRRLRMSQSQTLRGSGWRSAHHQGCVAIRCSAHSVVGEARLSSAPLRKPRRAEANGFSRRSDSGSCGTARQTLAARALPLGRPGASRASETRRRAGRRRLRAFAPTPQSSLTRCQLPLSGEHGRQTVASR